MVLSFHLHIIYLYVYSFWNRRISIHHSIALLIYIVVCIIISNHEYTAYAEPGRSIPVWGRIGDNGQIGNILGDFSWIFALIIIIGLGLMLNYHNWSDLGLYLIIAFILITFACVPLMIGSTRFASYWTYLLCGLILVVWFIGSLYPPSCATVQ